MNYEPGNAWSGSRGGRKITVWLMDGWQSYHFSSVQPALRNFHEMSPAFECKYQRKQLLEVILLATKQLHWQLCLKCLAQGNLSTCWGIRAHMSHFTSWEFPSCDQSVTLQLPASLTCRQPLHNTEHLFHRRFTEAKSDSAMIAKVKVA